MLPTGEDSIDVWPKDALVCLQVVQGGVQPGSEVGHFAQDCIGGMSPHRDGGSKNIFEFYKEEWERERGSNYFGSCFRGL